MAKTAFHWLLIVFMIGWFGAIMPGHQRGVVRLPGSDDLSGPIAGAPTCLMCTASQGSDDSDPNSDPARECAICFLKGVLNLPPVAVLTLPAEQLLAELAPQPIGAIHALDVSRMTRGRGPPIAHL